MTPPVVLVCGSRDWRDGDAILERLSQLPRGTTIVHGGARGADQLAGTIALALGFGVREYPAEWQLYGRKAGALRTVGMFDREQPDLVLAFWKDASRGTAITVGEAHRRGIEVEVFAA